VVFVVENALDLLSEKTAQNKDRFSATFLKNTQERDTREKRKREHSAFPRKKSFKKSRARRKQKEGSKKRERAFLPLSFSPHLRVYKCFI